ncbi:VWA domain-containing protein [Marinimicrobium alkaliphilum]|uniref:VWA domain-containing protein n=1 Tax=Marinimicrobium alkaliphilum TaxID=2202654 RepID=UPI000DBA1DF7|nr:VWA domain-containing protein [Marinimicrobium alkaliphilum]
MLEFQWLWLFLLLPLPLLMRALPPAEVRQAAVRVPFYNTAKRLQGQGLRAQRRWLGRSLLWLIWILLVTAAANPRWLGEPVSQVTTGRDVLIAVDVSGSMRIEDMRHRGEMIDRLQAIKIVIGNFIERRRGDRLGLVLFGSQAYLYAPLTHDLDTVNQLLQETEIGYAGERTAIGDGIGLSVKRLRERPENHRLLLILTDGANNAGELTPERGAQLAAMEGITIYSMGFGAEEMTVDGFFGQRTVNPTHDLDEDAMIAVAEMTGGRYFRARNIEELEEVHREFDRLEPIELDERVYRPLRTLFYWPLGAALLLSALMAIGRSVPNVGKRREVSA